MTDRPALDRLKAQVERANSDREVDEKKKGGPKKRSFRKSNRLREKRDAAVDFIARQNSISLSTDERERVGDVLENTFDVSVANSDPDQFLQQMRQGTHNRVRISNLRKCNLDAMQCVLGHYEWMASSGSDLKIYIRLLCAAAKVNPTPRLDLLSLTTQSAIDFSDGDDRKDTRRILSRHVCAMRWVISKDVHSFDLVEFQAKHGGGVDSWSRAWAKGQKRITASEADEPADTATVAAKRTAVTKSDGAVAVSASDADRDASENDKTETGDDREKSSSPAAEEHSESGDHHPRGGGSRGPDINQRALDYIVNETTFEPGQGVLALIVEDESTASGIRIVRSASIGTLRAPFPDETWEEMLATAARFMAERSTGIPSRSLPKA